MNFRRVKPKTFGAYFMGAVAAFRGLKPKTQMILAAAGALVLVAGVIGIVVAAQSGGDTPEPSAASTTPSPTPSAEPSAASTTPSSTPSAEPTVTRTSVDELLDKLNSAGLGGIKVGDQFRVTAELFESDAWGTGASGDYSVMLKAKGGADDLLVFVDESDADEWQDGTKVEMVVEMVEVTINGETTDGWLKARSVKTIAGGTSKEVKEGAARQELFSALTEYADTINGGAGATVIDSIGPGLTETAIDVNLNLGFASLSTLEAQATIKTMNGHIVDIADEKDSSTPIVKYYLAGDVVAENRYILDPWDVKFKGMLDD